MRALHVWFAKQNSASRQTIVPVDSAVEVELQTGTPSDQPIRSPAPARLSSGRTHKEKQARTQTAHRAAPYYAHPPKGYVTTKRLETVFL